MSDNVFVHKGGKLEKRQFRAKMHQIAPNCVSNFKIFPGMTSPDPHPWEGDTHSPDPSPALHFAPSATRWSPPWEFHTPPWNKRLDKSPVSDAQINRGWVTLGPNLGVFPLEQTRHVGVAKSEHPRLTNCEIIFEEFQPMWSQFTNVTDRQTDRQTDDMRSQYRALRWGRQVRVNQCMTTVSRHPRSPRVQT